MKVANLDGFRLEPYRPEPEFIEEIVEVIWKRLKGESSTVQSRRQIDNPGAGAGADEDSSIIISQDDAPSVQNAIAEWSRPFLFYFFLSVSHLFIRNFGRHKTVEAGPLKLL
ncbi:hypothetical protein CMV_027696 [Castanea mollissima]|uniref:Uncharacterized protein n=1 Tax=Castanea mollissima TaxID=60419 RepID=A0A8J4V942_9ROSI|nr:hypothetical protein CMV_027696 [Castanea mollissima]